MNIDKVYVCDIYRLEERTSNRYNTKVYMGKNFNSYDDDYVVNKCVFVKSALVYYSLLQGGFIDVETGQFYKLGYPSVNGELFVDVHRSKIHGSKLMGTNKKHYSKKKILKRYSEYKDGGNNEHK